MCTAIEPKHRRTQVKIYPEQNTYNNNIFWFTRENRHTKFSKFRLYLDAFFFFFTFAPALSLFIVHGFIYIWFDLILLYVPCVYVRRLGLYWCVCVCVVTWKLEKRHRHQDTPFTRHSHQMCMCSIYYIFCVQWIFLNVVMYARDNFCEKTGGSTYKHVLILNVLHTYTMHILLERYRH